MEFPTSLESLAYETAVAWARENAASGHAQSDPVKFGKTVAAVRAAVLSACLEDGPSAAAAVETPRAETKKDPKPPAAKKDAASKDPSPQSSPAAASESPASKDATGDAQTPASADTGGDPEVTYDQVAAAFLKVAKANRAKAMGALEKRGLASPRALKVEEYADFIQELES